MINLETKIYRIVSKLLDFLSENRDQETERLNSLLTLPIMAKDSFF